MQITDIRIRQMENEGKLRAVVSVTFDDQLVVHDVKIIESQGKFFLAMPSRRMANGTFRDSVHPINSDFRTLLEKTVIDKYIEDGGSPAAEYIEPVGDGDGGQAPEPVDFSVL